MKRTGKVLVILLLSVILLGVLAFFFTQTSMFRRIIVSELVSTIETTTNGTLTIERLSGNLFDGFVLHDVRLKLKTTTAYDSVDILHAERVLVRYNVFKLLKATELGARSIIIQRPTINLVKFSGDTLWNHQLLFKPVAPNQPPPQPFTQIVRLEALRIIDGNLRVRDYNTREGGISYVKGGAEKKQKYIDWGDLYIEDLDLDGHLFARGDAAVSARIDHLRFSDRTSGFFVHHLAFSTYLDSLQSRIDDASIITGHSNVSFSLEVAPPSVLQTGLISSLDKSGTTLTLKGPTISTYELTQFIPDLEFLGGSPGIDLVVDGEFGNLNVRKLELDFKGRGDIAISGQLRNLHDPRKLYMDLALNARSLSNGTVRTYVPGLGIPDLTGVGTVTIPSLTYVGTPFQFATDLDVRTTGAGNAKGEVALDIRTKDLGYTADLATTNLDFGKIINDPELATDLSATIKLHGRGTDYRTLTSTFDIHTTEPSQVAGYDFTYFNGTGVVDRGSADIDDMSFAMPGGPIADIDKAQIDFARENPTYFFDGTVKDFRIAKFVPSFPNKELMLDLDANITGIGTELTSIQGSIDAKIHNLTLAGEKLRDIYAHVELAPRDGNNTLAVTSEIADISIEGQFKLADLIQEVPQRFSAIATAFNEQYFPKEGDAGPAVLQTGSACRDSIDLDFRIRAKDLRPLSAIFPRMTLLAKGNINGEILGCASRDLNIYAETDSLILLFRERGGRIDTVLDLTSIDTSIFTRDSIRLARLTDSTALPRIHVTPSKLSLKIENMIEDPKTVLDSLVFALDFKDSIARYNSMLFTSPSATVEYRDQKLRYDIGSWINNKFRVHANGHAEFPEGDLKLLVDTLDLQLKDQRPYGLRPKNSLADKLYIWHNAEPITILLEQDGTLEIDTFGLWKEGLGSPETRDNIRLGARIDGDTIDYAFLEVPGLTVERLVEVLPPSNKTYKLDELTGRLNGLRVTMSNTLAKPEIELTTSLNDLSYRDLGFDSTTLNLKYINQAVRGEVYIKIDTSSLAFGEFQSIQIPWNNVLVAHIDSIPMLISFANYEGYSADSAAVLQRPLSAGLTARNFPIDLLSPFLPMFTTITGIGNIALNVAGTQENIDYRGTADIESGGFLLAANNVYYTFDGGLEFNRERLDLRDLVVRNTPVDDPNGSATVSGGLDLKGFSVSNFDISLMSDRLTVLTNASISSMKNIYGPLAISTQGTPFTFTGSMESPKLAGNIEVLHSTLTYQNEKTTRRVNTDGIRYRYFIGDSVVSDSAFTSPRPMASIFNDTTQWTAADSALWPMREENIFSDEEYTLADSMVDAIQAKRFRSDQTLNAGGTFADRLQYDIYLTVPGDAWVVTHLASTLGVLGERLQAELKTVGAPLHIYRGPERQLRLVGTIGITDRSTYRMYKTFVITEGEITFTGNPGNPAIDITAEHEGRDADDNNVIVRVNISNTLEDPKLTISIHVEDVGGGYTDRIGSEQELQEDAIYFLLTGRFKDQLAPTAQLNALEKAANQLGSQVANQLLNSLLGSSTTLRSVNLDLSGTPKIVIAGAYKDINWRLSGLKDNGSYDAGFEFEIPLSKFFDGSVARRGSVIIERQPPETLDSFSLDRAEWLTRFVMRFPF